MRAVKIGLKKVSLPDIHQVGTDFREYANHATEREQDNIIRITDRR